MVVSRIGTPPLSGQTSLEFECFVNVFAAYDALYSRTYRKGFLHSKDIGGTNYIDMINDEQPKK